MSSTRKARGPSKEDVNDGHEERKIWLDIKGEIERCISIQKRQKVIGPQIKELEEEYAKNAPTTQQIQELQDFYREMVKLTNEEQAILNDDPANILGAMDILIALRKASAQVDPDFSPAPGQLKIRGKPKPLKSDPVESQAGRNSPVVSVRDGNPIKMEDGEPAKGSSAEKAGKFVVGAQVAYKQSRPKEDGSQWIICNITGVQKIGGNKRYQVQDPEPDDLGNPGEIYMASVNSLIAIPGTDVELPDYPIGKSVLARYPETTTFYRAEVIANKGKGVCKLRFEDDQNQEMEVARRFVLNLEK